MFTMNTMEKDLWKLRLVYHSVECNIFLIHMHATAFFVNSSKFQWHSNLSTCSSLIVRQSKNCILLIPITIDMIEVTTKLGGKEGNALLYLTSILSYNQYFISGATRPHKILNYISKISVRYNNASLKLSHLSIFSTENEYKNQKTVGSIHVSISRQILI